ncbi:venom allergen 3-like [Zophobas morio]|uniref:venom allergen 3-like n=1 Tax=Zophobas morio TaxID=2755281 RepID=UPI003082E2C6
MMKAVFIALLACAFIVICASSGCKKKTIERKFTQAERSLIVKTHNSLRKSLEKGQVKEQPRAAKMKRLKWDARLAKQAQKIADTCKFKHVPVKDVRWAVGQNLFKLSSTDHIKGINVTEAIYAWFNEHELYTYPHYTKESGHYTQVVWANTKYVGCGYTFYKAGGKFKYQKLLVCNYGPAGNVQGYAPYKPWSRHEN